MIKWSIKHTYHPEMRGCMLRWPLMYSADRQVTWGHLLHFSFSQNLARITAHTHPVITWSRTRLKTCSRPSNDRNNWFCIYYILYHIYYITYILYHIYYIIYYIIYHIYCILYIIYHILYIIYDILYIIYYMLYIIYYILYIIYYIIYVIYYIL